MTAPQNGCVELSLFIVQGLVFRPLCAKRAWRRNLRRRAFWKKESKLNYAFENPGWKVTRWRWCPEAKESGSHCDFEFHHALLINPSTLPYFPCPLPVHHSVTCSDLKRSTVIGQGERPATSRVCLSAHTIRLRRSRTADRDHIVLQMCGASAGKSQIP